jgi:hypothetical protein
VEKSLEVEALSSWGSGDRSAKRRQRQGGTKTIETISEQFEMVVKIVRLRGENEPLNRMGPGRGCGMKQARERMCGENRRGAAKARGRNEARTWEVFAGVDADS